MRRLAPLGLLLAAHCAPAADGGEQVWAAGKDGLCLVGAGEQLRAGLITYGSGNTNCTLSGPAERQGETLTITPTGDSACRVQVTISDGRAVLGNREPACSYYCGPGADFAGRTLQQANRPAQSVTDFAGDPLC